MRPRSSCAVRPLTRFNLHAQTAVDADDLLTGILITGKTQRSPIWVPCRDRNGAGSGIFRVYLWEEHKSNYSIVVAALTLKWSRYSVLPLVVKGGPYGP